MTKANASTLTSLYPAPVILFGIDSSGKPKAARFRKDHASLAVKAASQLQLQVLANDNPKIAEIAARLPVGRVHATGRAFVPFIRRDLYDKLLAVASNGNALRQRLQQLLRLQARHRQLGVDLARISPRVGIRSALAIWSLHRKARRTAGTWQSSLKPMAICLRCVGAITRVSARSYVTAIGLAYSIPARDLRPSQKNHRSQWPSAAQNKPCAYSDQSRSANASEELVARLMSAISSWHKVTGHGWITGKQFRSMQPVT